ncbi:MAG: hypothetical protein DSY55_02315 [Clostridia bacterium]|nr:MAG: hypothetical protein DSY55_02315 [Clostridia bacterium]
MRCVPRKDFACQILSMPSVVSHLKREWFGVERNSKLMLCDWQPCRRLLRQKILTVMSMNKFCTKFSNLLSLIRSYLSLMWLGLTPAALAIWLFFHLGESRYNADRFVTRFIRWGVQRIARLDIEVAGREHLQSHQPAVFVNNHQHYLDAVVISEVFPQRTVVAAKMGLRRIPVAGKLFELAGNVFIDRSDPQKAVAALRRLGEKMRREKINLWIFPEGKLNHKKSGLLPFKKGPFHTAIQLQAPIVPVVTGPSYHFLDVLSGNRRPGKVWIEVLEPILTQGLTSDDVDELMAITRERMLAAYLDLESKIHEAFPQLAIAHEKTR